LRRSIATGVRAPDGRGGDPLRPFFTEEEGVESLILSLEVFLEPSFRPLPRSLAPSIPDSPVSPPTDASTSLFDRLILLALIFIIPLCVKVHHGGSSSESVAASDSDAVEYRSFGRGRLRWVLVLPMVPFRDTAEATGWGSSSGSGVEGSNRAEATDQ
jgi:hypothetical protein